MLSAAPRPTSRIPPPGMRAVAASLVPRLRRGGLLWCRTDAAAAVSAALPRRHSGLAAAAASLPAPAPPASPPPHIPVLLDEVLASFEGVRLGVYLDGTLGAAGHASALAAAHPEMHTLVGLDVDPLARDLASARLAAVAAARQAGAPLTSSPPPLSVHVRAANFRGLAAALASIGCGPPDGILLDLGFSSMQIDDPARGFSLTKDGPLDMRMGGDSGSTPSPSAAVIVNTWPEGDLAALLSSAGEERGARALAARIVAARAEAPLATTGDLLAALGLAGWRRRGGGIHPATRTFQALRIAANDELGALADALPAALDALAPGGRLGVISFHSLEDRAVKWAFLRAAGKGGGGGDEGGASLSGGGRWERAAAAAGAGGRPSPPPPPTVRILTRRPLMASPAEVAANPRARSAKLRVVEKL